MPWTVDFSTFTAYAEEMRGRNVIRDAINAAIRVAAGAILPEVPIESGTTLKAFSKIDWATSDSGGIGDLGMVGDPFEKAPEGTLSAKKGSGGFIEWYRNNYGKKDG
jgi:hypothetical protein